MFTAIPQPSPDPEPLLLGNLIVKVIGSGRRPVLVCECHCPFCRTTHALEDWPEEGREALGTTLSVQLPCPTGPFAGRDVLVALDQRHWSDNSKAVADHDQALRTWGPTWRRPPSKAAPRAPASDHRPGSGPTRRNVQPDRRQIERSAVLAILGEHGDVLPANPGDMARP